jgi:hypothetical protein
MLQLKSKHIFKFSHSTQEGSMGSQYQIYESVGQKLLKVEDFEDIHRHHPTTYMKYKDRPTMVVNGEVEEIIRNGDNPLISKDVVFMSKGSANVDVPSPIEGYIRNVNPSLGKVQIYDQPVGGKLVAQVLHMNPLKVKEGQHVDYGQPLGQQSNKAPYKVGLHAHIDLDPKSFERFINDVNSGVIVPGKYPTQTPDMHHNGSQLEPVKQSSLEVPDNFKPLYASADKQVRDLYAQAGIDFADGGQNTVGKVVYEAAKANLTEVEQMTVKSGQIHIAQKAPSGFGYTTVSFGAVEAANTDYSKIMEGLVALSNPQQLASLSPERNPTRDETVKARSIT